MKNSTLFISCILLFNCYSQGIFDLKSDTIVTDSSGFVWEVLYESDSTYSILFYGLDSMFINNINKHKFNVNSLGSYFFKKTPLKKIIPFKVNNNENTLIKVSRNTNHNNKDVYLEFEKRYFFFNNGDKSTDIILKEFISDYSYLLNCFKKKNLKGKSFFISDSDEPISGYEFTDGNNIYSVSIKIKSLDFNEKTLIFSNVIYGLNITVWIQKPKEWVIFKNK